MKREENRKLSAFGGSESARGERLVWQQQLRGVKHGAASFSQCSTTAVLVVVAVAICV